MDGPIIEWEPMSNREADDYAQWLRGEMQRLMIRAFSEPQKGGPIVTDVELPPVNRTLFLDVDVMGGK
mgnify:CR=1 FL=1